MSNTDETLMTEDQANIYLATAPGAYAFFCDLDEIRPEILSDGRRAYKRSELDRYLAQVRARAAGLISKAE